VSLIPERKPRNDDDRRASDRRRKDRRANVIDRTWLGILTVMWVWTALALSTRQAEVNANRVEGAKQRCQLAREIVHTLEDFHVAPAQRARIQGNYEACLKVLPVKERKEVKDGK
jgi:hypothetical protein